MKPFIVWCAFVFIIFSNQSFAANNQGGRDLKVEEFNSKLVQDFYNRFFNMHQIKEASIVVSEDYRQHSPSVPDGKAPFIEYFESYFSEHPGARARIVRSGTFGNLVYLHAHATSKEGDRGQAVIDIFRVENGKIVEHWDVIQDVPETQANNNTMF